jgi:hypothetical protein
MALRIVAVNGVRNDAPPGLTIDLRAAVPGMDQRTQPGEHRGAAGAELEMESVDVVASRRAARVGVPEPKWD